MNKLQLPRKIATLQRVTNKSHIVVNIIFILVKLASYVATDAILFLHTAYFLVFYLQSLALSV